MAELADAQDLGSCEDIRVGSTPTTRTNKADLLFKYYSKSAFNHLKMSCFLLK